MASCSTSFCLQTMAAFECSRENYGQLGSVFSDELLAMSVDQGRLQTRKVSRNLHAPLFWKLLWNVHPHMLERNQARGVTRSQSKAKGTVPRMMEREDSRTAGGAAESEPGGPPAPKERSFPEDKTGHIPSMCERPFAQLCQFGVGVGSDNQYINHKADAKTIPGENKMSYKTERVTTVKTTGLGQERRVGGCHGSISRASWPSPCHQKR